MSGMRYVWKAGRRPTMHILKIHPIYGSEYTPLEPLCETRIAFDRTINAPFGLGRPVCKKCQKIAAKLYAVGK